MYHHQQVMQIKPGTTRHAPDLEAIIPMESIRAHTKTQDVRSVTDNQLNLYRAAAIEAAELYTGRILTGAMQVTQPIATVGGCSTWRKTIRIRLDHPTMDGLITLQSGLGGVNDQVIQVKPGSRSVTVPNMVEDISGASCCNENSTGNENYGVMATYLTGVTCSEDIPVGIIYGCLKFIAWAVMNAGDEILTIRNRESSSETGISGTNDGAWASGAIEHWRMYKAGA